MSGEVNLDIHKKSEQGIVAPGEMAGEQNQYEKYKKIWTSRRIDESGLVKLVAELRTNGAETVLLILNNSDPHSNSPVRSTSFTHLNHQSIIYGYANGKNIDELANELRVKERQEAIIKFLCAVNGYLP